MKILENLGKYSRVIWGWLTSGNAKKGLLQAREVVSTINTLAPNKTLAEALKVFDLYALPISDVMRDGISEEEVKMLLGRAGAMILEKKLGVSTTDANILLNAAYKETK